MGEGVNLAELLVRISGDARGLTAAFGKSVDEAKQFERGVGGALKGAGTALVGITKAAVTFAAAMTAVGVATATAMVAVGMESVDSMAKLSDKTGISTEKLAGLKVQAELTGVSFESLTAGMIRGQRAVGEAANGNAELSKSFTQLGLDISKLRTMSPDQQFGAIADALNGVGNASERTRLQFQIFGRSGVELTNIIRAGSEGMAEGAKEAERLGLSFSRIDAAKVEAANDSIQRLKLLLTGVSQQLAIASAPYLDAIATKMLEATGSAEQMHTRVQSVMEGVAYAIGVGADALHILNIAWKGVQVVVTAFGQVFYNVMNAQVTIIAEVAKVIGTIFEAVFTKIGSTAEYFLNKLADGVSYFNEEAASELRAMGQSVNATASGIGSAVSDMVKSTADGFTEVTSGLATEANKAGADARAELVAALNDEFPSFGIKQWFAEVEAQATVTANKVAATIAAAQGGGGEAPIQGPEAPGEGDQKKNDEQAKKLEQLQKDLATESEIEVQALADKKALLAELEAADQLSADEANAMREKAEQQHAQKMGTIQENEAKRRRQIEQKGLMTGLSMAQDGAGALSAIIEASGKKNTGMAKAIGVVQAVISTAIAIAKANELGYPASIPAMALAAATGAAQIAAIGAANYGGGTSSSGGVAAAPGAAPSTALGTGAIPGADAGQNIRVTLGDDDDFISKRSVRKLIEKISEQTRDGVMIRGIRVN